MIVTIDGRPIPCQPSQTILDVAVKNGIFIPALCHLKGRPQRAVCRLCMVEVDDQSRLASACSTPVAEGMHIRTDTPRVKTARSIIMEMILAEHGSSQSEQIMALAARLGVCPEAGRISVAKAEADFSRKESRYLRLDPGLCVHCDRCIRSCDRGLIHRNGRGTNTVFAFGDDVGIEQAGCVHCGDCAAACPAGAIRLERLGGKLIDSTWE